MSSQNIPVGSPLAVKAFSVATFARMSRQATFRSKMTGPAPKDAAATRALKKTVTSPGMPIVEIRDLSVGAGDNADYDIVDLLSGLPVMGDETLSGKGMTMKFATQNIRIDQYRGMVDPGGRMTKKRTLHDLRMLAMGNLEGWNNNMLDNIAYVHLAGARGQQGGKDWSSVPLASHPAFASIMVNPVLPPTYNRRWVVGTGLGSISNLDSADTLKLGTIDELRTEIDESDYPLQGVRLEGDIAADDEDPLYVMRVSPRGYQQLRDTSTDKDWNTLVSAAVTRASISKHPLFGNGDLLWRGILIKKTRRAIRYAAGALVPEYNSSGTLVNTAAGAQFDRALLLGAQAMACAWGAGGDSNYHLTWHEEKTDHGARVEISTSLIGGWRKLTFTLDGVTTDHGVWTVDHYNDVT